MSWKNKIYTGLSLLPLLLIGSTFPIFPPPAELVSAPVVIKGNWISRLEAAPGQGYSLATNEVLRPCLVDMRARKESYDFHSSFGRSGRRLDIFTYFRDALPAPIDHAWLEKILRVRRSKINGITVYHHYIPAKVITDAYYATLDESSVRFHPRADSLMRVGDIPGFFENCGAYYIRSIGRRTTLMSLFSYRTTTPEPDRDFERALEIEVKRMNFRGAGQTKKNDFENRSHKSFLKLARSYFLRVDYRVLGIQAYKTPGSEEAKDPTRTGALLVAEYRRETKKFLKAAQASGVGHVSKLELIAWVENSLFSGYLPLQRTRLKDGRYIGRFQIQMNLTDNAEFYRRAIHARELMEGTYKKAVACKEEFDRKYRVAGPDSALKPLYRHRVLLNRAGGAETMKLSEMEKFLTDKRIKEIFQVYRKFDLLSGQCLNQLKDKDLRYYSYRDFTRRGIYGGKYGDKCEGVEERLNYIPYRMVRFFCPPLSAD